MVEVIAQSLLLEKGKAAHDWCTRPEGCQEFWTGSGDWKGLLDSAHRKPNLERRSAVSKVIVEQYEAASLKPPTAGLQAFEEGAAVVTVGHQLQAGGGPAYFHYKILSALRWSRQLREAGIESVAVFWMASEDHDFEEVSRTVGAQSDAFVWSPETIAGSTPVGRIAWDANAERDWLAFCERQGLVSERSFSQVPGQTESLAHRLRQWIQGWFP
ncbi:MAG: bacillithiol biosynthesis protein BshC, partial [Flavobacteriales bacterium]